MADSLDDLKPRQGRYLYFGDVACCKACINVKIECLFVAGLAIFCSPNRLVFLEYGDIFCSGLELKLERILKNFNSLESKAFNIWKKLI